MDLYGSSDEHWGSQLYREKNNMNIKTDNHKKRASVQVYIHLNVIIYGGGKKVRLEIYCVLMAKQKKKKN